MHQAGKGDSIINKGSLNGIASLAQKSYSCKSKRADVALVQSVAYSVAEPGICNLARFCPICRRCDGIAAQSVMPSGVGRGAQEPAFQRISSARTSTDWIAPADDCIGAAVRSVSVAS